MSEKRKGDAVSGGARATDTLFGEQMKITGGAEEKSDEIKRSDLAENEKITFAEEKTRRKLLGAREHQRKNRT